MSGRPLPPVPREQFQLRGHLELTLTLWQVAYRHEDHNHTFARGRGAVCGWGTYIERGTRRTPLLVWFDHLDRDIALYGTSTEYREWRDLTAMPEVLQQLTDALAARIAGTRGHTQV